MEISNLQKLCDDGQIAELGHGVPRRVYEFQKYLGIDNYVLIPVSAIDFSVQGESDLQIDDENGVVVGYLCFCRRLGEVNPADLTSLRFLCYLADLSGENLAVPYRFERDYVAVRELFVDEYIKRYQPGSAIWGGFIHASDDMFGTNSFGRSISTIQGIPDINLTTKLHRISLSRGLRSTSHADRFLRYYHQLELLYDLVLVKEIQKMGDDLKSIARIMSAYSKMEIDRMQDIARKYCDDVHGVCHVMTKVANYKDRIVIIVDEYGKTNNPLSDEHLRSKFWRMVEAGAVSAVEAKEKGFAGNEKQFEQKIINIACYWIYRFRCCVVHHRVGEYIMDEKDDDIIVDVGESLVKCLISSMFRNEKLRELF